MIKLIDEAALCAKKKPQRVVFPDALDERVIRAAHHLAEYGYALPILLANPFELRNFCHKNHIKSDSLTVIDPAHSPLLDQFVTCRIQTIADKSTEEIRTELSHPLWFGAMMLAEGKADFCIGGNLSSTSAVLRAAIKVVGLTEGIRTVSSIFFMVAPDSDKVLGFADCVVVPEPTAEQLADIAIATADSFARFTNETPIVAMLSFSSGGSTKHPLAMLVSEATQIAQSKVPTLQIDGELQFDAAFVPEIAAQKVPNSPLKGQANVMIFPNLSAGNIGYKITQRMAGYAAIGPIIQGLKRPMHDLSRGCSTQDIIETVLVAIKMATAPLGSPKT